MAPWNYPVRNVHPRARRATAKLTQRDGTTHQPWRFPAEKPARVRLMTDRRERWLRQIKENDIMNWDRVEGSWKQFKGKAQQQWGKLTDDDLTMVEGKRAELAGKIQERYGIAKDEAERQIDDWSNSLN
jgi:uncharacterized protein YjbJ (UPF0337 family)